MVEQRMPERLPERARPERVLAEARPGADRDGEMAGRKGGYDHMVAAAPRPLEPAAPAQEIGANVGRLVQETTDSLRAAMMLSVVPDAGFGAVQAAFAAMVTEMMRNNIRLAQGMLRIYGPQEHAALMQRCMRYWIDVAVDGQAAMLRLTRPTTEQAPGNADQPHGTAH